MTVSDLLKAFEGVPPETEVRVINSDAWAHWSIQGVYYEEGTPLDIEIGVWTNESSHA